MMTIKDLDRLLRIKGNRDRIQIATDIPLSLLKDLLKIAEN